MADGSALIDNSFTPDAENARAFRRALGQFATGVTLITIESDGGPMGFIANSFSSLSMDPPLIMWALSKSSGRFAAYQGAQHFAVHVLGAQDGGIVDRFMRGGAGFDGLAHELNAHRVPILTGALARFECTLHQLHEGGDHVIVVGQVQRAAIQDGAPLVFSGGQMGRFTAGI